MEAIHERRRKYPRSITKYNVWRKDFKTKLTFNAGPAENVEEFVRELPISTAVEVLVPGGRYSCRYYSCS
eukprot:SAG11_NODE_632_length_8057_cov_6.472481_7_plen_70_part_00